MKITCAGLVFVIGFLILLFGILGQTGFTFYGDISYDNAANNIYCIALAFEYAIKQAYIWIGILLIITSVYLLACAFSMIREKDADIKNKEMQNASQDMALTYLAKYKALLDSGVITQEEFDDKKKELLGL